MPAADAITVFGAAHLDRLLRLTARTIPGASNAGLVEERAGGVGLNVARTLALLGLPVLMVSRVGSDAVADRVLAAAAEAGVMADGIVRASGPTASYHAVVAADGSLVIGIADARLYAGVTPESIAGPVAGAAASPLWIVDANLPPATVDFLIRARAGRPLVVCATAPDKARALVPLLSRMPTLLCNRPEAEAMLEAEAAGLSTHDLAAAFLARSVRSGVVSDGDGALAAWSDGAIRLFTPFAATTVASVNGAGDALAAGLSFGLAEGRSLFEAVPFALATAALKVEHADPVRPDLSAALVAQRLAAETAKVPS